MIKLEWMNDDLRDSGCATWGVPWEQGALKRGDPVALTDHSGRGVPVQSRILAFWPDGSVKWTAHSAVFTGSSPEGFYMGKGTPAEPRVKITATETENCITVDTGAMACRIGRVGPSVIQSVFRNEREYCSDGRLVCLLEEKQGEEGSRRYREESFESVVVKAVLEESGPVRAVARVEGRHRSLKGGREWLPFIVRLYFYSGARSFKIIHTFLYDGDKHLDYIKGLGMEFSVPLSGGLYNRHVRFAGDTGLFSEAVQLLSTWRPRLPARIYERQLEGARLELDSEERAPGPALLDTITAWDSFKLVQISPDSYDIRKRTGEGCCWINAARGNRSGGLAYAGGENGGLAAVIRNFWQKYPGSLEITGMTQSRAALKLWFWSPDSRPMDLRHYDVRAHVDSYYEGFDELRSTPRGIANTSEATVWCFDETPDRRTLLECVDRTQSPRLLKCRPEHYHGSGAFGVWSLADRSTETRAWLEDRLDEAVDFYRREIEQRKWYGFWDYGDVMHTYDPARHTWRYDMGGYAWQNTELVPTYWLWLTYLRTGGQEVFRLAEAMCRHTAEVDAYHLGEYAGLGSRHNVLHWGCGCKEARISMAGHHRFYYYLTGDERTGDILEEVRDADYATEKLDPMRAYAPKDEYPTHTRSGPDWAAFCSNWMTRWERFEDTYYRDKILTGLKCLKAAPFGLYGRSLFGYDPRSGELFHPGGEEGSGSHLVICMGAPQIWMELARLIRDPEWDKMLADYGEFYALSPGEKSARTSGKIDGASEWSFPYFASAMMAYAAAYKKDGRLARRVWELLAGVVNESRKLEARAVDGGEYIAPVREIPWISTNTVSQWCLNTIVSMELVGDYLPEKPEELFKGDGKAAQRK